MNIPDQSEPEVFKEHNGFEVYPMPMFAGMETADVTALAQWYQDALGFAVMFKAPVVAAEPGMVHLRRRKYQDILIHSAACARAFDEVQGLSLNFQAGEDVDQLCARVAAARAFGKSCVAAPVDTPWNTREARIIDPDGRLLVFSQPRFDPELTERMRRMFETDEAGTR